MTKEERLLKRVPKYFCRHCKENFRPYDHKMILKKSSGICNHCISNLEYRTDLDERENTYFKDVIEKRKR